MAREACDFGTTQRAKPRKPREYKSRHSIVRAFACAGKNPCESLTVYMRRTRKAMEDIDAASFSVPLYVASQRQDQAQPLGPRPKTGEDPATRQRTP